MKILHVLASLSIRIGGPSVTAVGLARALQAHGVQTSVFTTDLLKPAESKFRTGGATIEDMPLGANEIDLSIYPVQKPYRLAYSPSLSRALDSSAGRYDLLHIHGINLYPQIAAWSAANKNHRPYVISPKGALDPWIRGKGRVRKAINDALWQRRWFNGASALHLTTEDERRLVGHMNIKAPHVVVPNGLDIGYFQQGGDPAAFRARWLDGYNGPLILNHGRISLKKGHDILISAMALVDRDVPVRLAIIGVDDENQTPALRLQAESLGIGGKVTFVPNLVGDELRNAISAADVWVLPSHTENFGVAVVEAMAAGRPVVTSPHVNIAPDAAAAGALVMVPNTVEDTAQAISDLLRSRERRDVLGRNASEYAWRYDWSTVAKQFIRFYEQVIEDHSRK